MIGPFISSSIGASTFPLFVTVNRPEAAVSRFAAGISIISYPSGSSSFQENLSGFAAFNPIENLVLPLAFTVSILGEPLRRTKEARLASPPVFNHAPL